MTAEKDRIAKAALAELPDEGAILLDAGTTTARLAELPAPRPGADRADQLPADRAVAGRPGQPHRDAARRPGARDDRRHRRRLGARDALAQTYVDVAFMATNGVSVRRGLTTPDLAEAAVKRAMIAAARRVVLLADHTKASVDHLVRFGELADVDTLRHRQRSRRAHRREIASYGLA